MLCLEATVGYDSVASGWYVWPAHSDRKPGLMHLQVEFAKVIREPVNADKSWFDSSVLSTALNGDTTVWQDPRSKVNFFGDGAGKDGQLARVIDEILVVQGPMSVKVTM